MSLAHAFLLAAHLVGPSPAAVAPPLIVLAEHRIRRSATGTCVESDHDPRRIRKLPGAPAESTRARDPLQDSWVHCADPDSPTGSIAPSRAPTPR